MNSSPRAHEPVDERTLSRLKWRCRRGLLENDLFLERFFRQHGDPLSRAQAQALEDLMDLSDNDLLDLLLARKSLTDIRPELARDDVLALLEILREPR
ncbi:MAG: succinate dehydrogenase assembly factor 2 [Rhodoferax sp.]|nr:succinate dehydrogenase assembly factor 2 [Rhodoferax sp.]